MSGRDDDDLTPTHGLAQPFSGVRVNLVEIAFATNEIVRGLHEAARQIDGATGVARKHLCAELGDRLVEIGGVLVTAGVALKEEAEG